MKGSCNCDLHTDECNGNEQADIKKQILKSIYKGECICGG